MPTENARTLRINTVYQHFKGEFYLVLCEAKHSDTGEHYAVYQHIGRDAYTCIRPTEEFLSLIDTEKYPNEKLTYRFTEWDQAEATGSIAEHNYSFHPQEPTGNLCVPGIYRHFKNGFVRVEYLARDHATQEDYIVYSFLSSGDDHTIIARPRKSFFEPVDKTKYPTVKQDARFAPWYFHSPSTDRRRYTP